MEISKNGIELIKRFEGCRLKAYKAVKTEKYYTIGYGHYGADVKPNQEITQIQADNLLIKDLKKYCDYVNDENYVPCIKELNQNQFDALVSFCYNCGPSNLKTLCRDRTPKEISTALTRYNKSGGVVLNGLVTRRKAEQELFNKKMHILGKMPIDTVAREVISGKWGTGDRRKKLLESAGYDYYKVQKRVNELLK